MHIIRVYHKRGGLAAEFKGLDAERLMRDYFHGEPSSYNFYILR